jgi:hypothetical protein
MKRLVIPVVTGATGILNKRIEISGKNIKNVFNKFPAKTSE